MAGAGAAGASLDWEPAPELGWVAPHVAAEFPGLGIAWIEVDGRRRPQPRAGSAAPARPLRPLLRLTRDPHARTADSLGLPRLLPPDRPRPRSHSHPGRAARARSPAGRRLRQPRHARRRADDRHGRDRGRAARLRRRAARRAALHPRLGPGRVARRATGGAGAGDADDRRRAQRRWRCSSAAGGRGSRSRGRAPVASRSPPCRSTAFPRSPSTRRSGSPRGDAAIGTSSLTSSLLSASVGDLHSDRAMPDLLDRDTLDGASRGRRRAPRPRGAAAPDRPPRARARLASPPRPFRGSRSTLGPRRSREPRVPVSASWSGFATRWPTGSRVARSAARATGRAGDPQPRAAASGCWRRRPSTSGCGSPAPTSVSRVAATGTPARASVRSGC